jgi:small subunit ribosomal protein S20
LFDKINLNGHSSALKFWHQSGIYQVANSSQARKRARQSETRRRHNASQRSAMRTALKRTLSAIGDGDYDQASTAYKAVVPVLDKAVNHGIISKNKAARHKSRLNSKVKALQS